MIGKTNQVTGNVNKPETRHGNRFNELFVAASRSAGSYFENPDSRKQ